MPSPEAAPSARRPHAVLETTEPNGVVAPMHGKAMPVMLMTPDDVERWLKGASVEDALRMQSRAGRWPRDAAAGERFRRRPYG
jgi:putative SOS response-associated peptidase YedK